MMEMSKCCYYGIDDDSSDWFQQPMVAIPPPCSSSSWLSPAPSLPIIMMSDHDDVLHGAACDHGALAGTGGCTTADLVIRKEETPGSYLPIPALAAVDDDVDHCLYHQLQVDFDSSSLPAPARTAGGGHRDDELLMLPFSDIDLDAFADELKASPQHSLDTAIAPAGGHHFGTQNDDAFRDMELDMKSQQHDAAPRGAGTALVGDDSLSVVVVQGYEMGVRYAAEHKPRMIPAKMETPLPLPPPPPPSQVRSRRKGGAAGKTRLHHIGFEDLRKFFYMPITRAAREMNVGLTVLKKRCRELGVARWPHRKMKSLKALMLNVQEMGSNGMSAEAMRRELAALETCCALMEQNPAVELTERTKKLRQACFKENYKRRAAAVGMLDHCFSFAADRHQQHHALPPAPATAAIIREKISSATDDHSTAAACMRWVHT